MFPAGSTSEPPETLVLRPAVLKTFVKGLIAIAVFSIFLQINASTIVNYFIFLALTIGLVAALCAIKRRSVFVLNDDGISVKRFTKAPNVVRYTNILEMSVSQGMLARRFKCGTVFFILKEGRGSVKVMGGGTAERLEDIPDPQNVYEWISSHLGAFPMR
jgi:uncharacterized membrane protein YdbT with pleckstrin-like domain